MSEAKFDQVNYSTKETAAAMRKALREAFPGVKFSVRMARGTAYGWLDVTWTDGPRSEDVRAIVATFEDQRFDSMTETYQGVEPTLYSREDGSLYEIRWSCCGAQVQRQISDEADAWARGIAVRGSRWWPEGVDAWRDDAYLSARELLAGIDLRDGFPDDPHAAFTN